jgi:small subunit ribosomal protein S7
MRKERAKKRELLPDPRFNDQLVTRFVNNLMLHGKKSVAYSIFFGLVGSIATPMAVPNDSAGDTQAKNLFSLFLHHHLSS